MTSVLVGMFFAAVVAALIFYAVRLVLATRRREMFAVSSTRTSPRPNCLARIHPASVVFARAPRRQRRTAAGTDGGARRRAAAHRPRGHRRPRRRVRLPRRADRVRCVRAAARREGLHARVVRRRDRGGGRAVDRPARAGAEALTGIRAQLPEILDTLAASLRAGHGFDHGLKTVASRRRRAGRARVHSGSWPRFTWAARSKTRWPSSGAGSGRPTSSSSWTRSRSSGRSAAAWPSSSSSWRRPSRSREQFRRNLRAITGQVRISANVLTGLPIVAAVLADAAQPQLHEPPLALLERAHPGARRPDHDPLRLVRAAAGRRGEVVAMLLLVLAALTLSASIYVASSAVTASARRRHSAVAVVRRWSAASGALRGDAPGRAKTAGCPADRSASHLGEARRQPAAAARLCRSRRTRDGADLCRLPAPARGGRRLRGAADRQDRRRAGRRDAAARGRLRDRRLPHSEAAAQPPHGSPPRRRSATPCRTHSICSR